LDTTIYISSPDSWSVHDISYRFNYITPGTHNNLNLYCLAKSWVRHRLINTNPDTNNSDYLIVSEWGVSLKGPTDTLMPWIHKTWRRTYKYGVQMPAAAHSVNAKLTRNGITRDTSIIFTVPPFDTTVVEIRY